MFNGTRSTTPDDQYTDLEDWLDALGDMGINTAGAFPEVYTALDAVDAVSRHFSEFRASRAEGGIAVGARHLVKQTELSHDDFMAKAHQFAFAENEEHLEKVGKLFDRTMNTAQTLAAAAFRREGDRALDVIRPLFDATAARIAAAWSDIPYGVTNLERAHRVGVADQWATIEGEMVTWKNISVLISAWFVNGVINTSGASSKDRYAPGMFMFEDYAALAETYVRGGEVPRAGEACVKARPKLLTIAEVDKLGSVNVTVLEGDDARRASHQEKQRLDAAFTELESQAPPRVKLHSAGRAS